MGIYDSLYGQQYSDLTTPEDQTVATRVSGRIARRS
mgnify:CR=1 FL=1